MKTTITFSILIWINSSRAKDNEAEIFARVTVNQRRVNISLKRKINIDSWDKAKSRVKGTGQEARVINIYTLRTKSIEFAALNDNEIENIEEKYKKIFNVN
ncbi:MAG: Arm DNA-binding domain-containing protein [Lutibacter sp.]|nr:Arm DNA-binding domain-containing protein [Lutibacter sp.]